MSNEIFSDVNIDGERIFMTVNENCISFGNRFEQTAKWRFDPQDRQDVIRHALDLFRNYLSLCHRGEFGRAVKAYRRALTSRVTTPRQGFWHLFEGRRAYPLSRKWAAIEWR